MLCVGKNETAAGTVSVRLNNGDQSKGTISVEECFEWLKNAQDTFCRDF